MCQNIFEFKKLALVVTLHTLMMFANLSVSISCPFITIPATVSNKIINQDVTLIASWENTTETKLSNGETNFTTFKVEKILHSKGKYSFKEQEFIVVAGSYPKEKHQRVLLHGDYNSTWEWSDPSPLTKDVIQYVNDLPLQGLAELERLKHFLNYLEHPDELISDDAYYEFQHASIDSILMLAEILPRDKIRTWVFNDNYKTHARRELYGVLLGLCANEKDKEDLHQLCLLETTEYRQGIDGCMKGYLLLTGEDGLKQLEQTKLIVKAEKSIPVQRNEIYSVLSAIRFMYHYGGNKISKERLVQSMRIFLTHKNLSDLAITELGRWKDWNTSDDLIALYKKTPDTDRRLKRAIAGFFVVCEADKKKDDPTDPPHVTKAKTFLAEMETTDPKIVEYARKVNGD